MNVLDFYRSLWDNFNWFGRVLLFWVFILVFPMIFLGCLLFYLIGLCIKDEENG